ncbi:MAG: TetR family transcriptional regulator [Phycisphaerae bacterium]|jgi:AcrR family transcriptional regulator
MRSKMRKNWKRARSSEQKEVRKNDILSSTSNLFIDKEYDQISLAMIAEGAGMSKPNIYKYFDSKEDIFLNLALKSFVDALEYQKKHLDDIDNDDIEAFCRRWIENVIQCDFFLRLCPIVSTTIERNSSVETFNTYRANLGPVIDFGAEIVCSKITGLTPLQGRMFLQYACAFQSGWYSYLRPSETLRKISSNEEFDGYVVSGLNMITEALTILVNGMLAKN